MNLNASAPRRWCAPFLPVLLSLAANPLAAQSEPGNSEPLPPVPTTSTAPQELSTASTPIEPSSDGRDGGEGIAQPVVRDDQSLPLPIPAIIRPSDSGDELIQPATGNPYFLGFAAGPYFPPAGQRLDPTIAERALASGDDERPHEQTYGFIMFQQRMTTRTLSELESVGVRFIEFHPHYCMKVAVPAAQLHVAASHPAVRWLGVARSWQKIHPMLAGTLGNATPSDVLDVMITAFESDMNPGSTWIPAGDGMVHEIGPGGEELTRVLTNPPSKIWMSNGWQQRALQERGVVIDEYLPESQCFRARITSDVLPRILAMDFVQFVESDVPDQPLHDESTPLIGADHPRAVYDGGNASVAIIGEIDSGFETSHTMLNHVFGVGWEEIAGSPSPWDDPCGHGSHVAGTILGLPTASVAGYTGMAPGLGSANTLRIRNVRIFPGTTYGSCGTSTSSHSARYGHMRGNYTDGSGNVSAPPHTINNSWGSPGSWTGTESNARTLDSEIWTQDQLYVFSAGNSGSGAGTIGLPAVAKNAFTVGNVLDYRNSVVGDPGTIWTSSSRGPCADGRWKPNVAAPGRWIRSADSRVTTSYTDKSGTSMAAPHVTGLAAQLVDHYAWTRYAPHRLASLIMATADTNANVSLSTPSASHLDNYGTGLVNAEKAHYTETDWSWTNWGFTESWSGGWQWRHGDFTVAANTVRLVVCMTYHETSASSGASQALVNDMDLWIDRDPIDPGGNTGEYFAQQSSLDNTEIRTINNPAAGPWRWKVFPDNVSLLGSVRCSVTVLQIKNDYSPNLNLTVTASDQYVQPSDHVDVTARVTPSDYMAKSVFLDSSVTSSGRVLHGSTTTLRDGIVTDLLSNQHGGYDVTLGLIEDDVPRSAVWEVSWSTEGVKSWSTEARSDSATNATTSVSITVDGTAPSLVSRLRSTTHTANQWSNNPNIAYSWNAATDNLSGVDGYGLFTSQSATGAPGNTRDIGAVTTYSETLGDSNGWYYKMKTVDRSGNWTTNFAVTGPYMIDTVDPGLPTNLRSTSHTAGTWSNDPSVDFAWNAASDDRSGVDGYGEAWATSSPVGVGNAKDMEQTVTTRTRTFSSNASGWYYALKTVDNAGNWTNTTVETGPYLIDTVNPSGPSGLSSPSHTTGTWSSNTSVAVNWTAATDAHSGLAGYRAVWDQSASTTVAPGARNVGPGATSLSRTLAASSQGWYLHLRALDVAGNWGPTRHIGPFLIDDRAPGGPSGLNSTTHTAGAWSSLTGINMAWTAASDGESGLAGYRGVWDSSASTTPSGSQNLGPGATSASRTLTAGTWYFHLRARDVAGNWGTTRHAGPYRIDLGAPNAALSIDSGNPTTTALAVALAVTASDPGSGLDSMRFRNDGGSWSSWEAFAPAKAWNLSNGGGSSATGTRTVEVQVRDNASNVRTASDTIYYYAEVQYFGNACAGSAGIPLLNVSGVPGVGRTVTLATLNTAAPAQALYFGLSNTNWLGIPLPLDLGLLGVSGCFVNISLDIPLGTGPVAPVSIPIPSDPLAIGAVTYYQNLLFGDPSGKLVVTTRGAEITISGF